MADRSRASVPGDRAPQTTRRSLVKGAAWAAPAMLVSTAAPALAVSQLTCATLEWTAFPTRLVSGRLRDGGSTSVGDVSVTLRRTSDRAYHADSFTVDRGALRLRSNNLVGNAAGTLQTLTLEFGVDVRNVSLRVYDFDWDRYESTPGIWQSFRDQVYIPQGAARPEDIMRGEDVVGEGTPGDPFTGSDEAKGNVLGAPGESGEASYCVDLVWRGPVREISLAYVQATREGIMTNPTIWISNVDFCV